ncbi:MAG: hypothetical protein AABX89_01445 [Candidatus Thermoplasmatota archaeon]
MPEVRLHDDCRKVFVELRPVQRKAILAWADVLRQDPTAGNQVQRSRMPKRLQRKYGLTNLWRIALPEGWRSLYTLEAAPGNVVVVVLLIVDHKEYDRLFGYSTS